MKRSMKMAVMIMMVCLLIVLTACGGSNSGGNEPASSTPSNSSSTKTPKEEPKKEEPKEEAPALPDLGGYTIRIGANYDDTPKEDSPIGLERIKRLKEIEETYNVKIEYVTVPQKEIVEKFTSSVLAGEPFVEIMRIDHYNVIPSMAERGIVLPLDDLVDLHSQDFLPLNLMETVSSHKGKIYGFNTGFAHSYGVYINKTLFQKLGLPDVRAMADEGTWTWDAFLDVAKKATQDTDGDGAIDTWGMAAFHQDFAANLVISNGGEFVTKDGQVALDSPKTIEAFEFLQRLYQTDKVVRFEEPGNWGEQRKFFPEGNVAMMPGFAWEGGGLKTNMTEYEWSYLPFPKGPNAGSEYKSAYSAVPMYFIPKGVKHPKEIAQIWIELQLWDMAEESRRNTYEAWFNFDEDIETAETLSKNVVPLNIGSFPNFPLWGILESITKGEATPAVAVEKVKQEAQASVDAVMKQ
jgi:multiple sugar transport system substrate-binding protein